MRKRSKADRFFRWIDLNITKIVMGVAIIFLFTKNIDANRQRHKYQMKMIEATEKYNDMKNDWSRCYVTQANAIQKASKCNSDLYDLRKWLQEKYNKKEI